MKINAEKSVVKEWLNTLSTAAKQERYQNLWKRVYRLVEVPARRRVVVNLTRIDTNTKDGDNVIIPGKVLSSGEITHKVKIAAMEYSDSARKSLTDAGCKVVPLKEMLNAENVHVIV